MNIQNIEAMIASAVKSAVEKNESSEDLEWNEDDDEKYQKWMSNFKSREEKLTCFEVPKRWSKNTTIRQYKHRLIKLSEIIKTMEAEVFQQFKYVNNLCKFYIIYIYIYINFIYLIL